MKISIETAAYIIEQRAQKVRWKTLGAMLDMRAGALREEIRKAQRRGFDAWS